MSSIKVVIMPLKFSHGRDKAMQVKMSARVFEQQKCASLHITNPNCSRHYVGVIVTVCDDEDASVSSCQAGSVMQLVHPLSVS